MRHNQDGARGQTQDALSRTPKQHLFNVCHPTVHRHDDHIHVEVTRQLYDLQKRGPFDNHGFYSRLATFEARYKLGVVRFGLSS
jgi:hypothetical protein